MDREELLNIQSKPRHKPTQPPKPNRKRILIISIFAAIFVLLFVCAVVITLWTQGFGIQKTEQPSPDIPTQEEVKAYEDFKHKYKRFLLTASSDDHRLAIFVQNYRTIKAMNELSQGRYTLEVNEFTDLTDTEFARRYTGLKGLEPSEEQVQDFIDKIQDDLLVGREEQKDDELPTLVDNRANCQPARHQMTCGACYAFTATSAIECEYKMKKNVSVELSPQQLVDCSFNYGNEGCEGGLMRYAFRYIKDHNITTEQNYPYTNSEHLCKEEGGAYSIKSYTKIRSQSVSALKKALASHVLTVAIATTPGMKYYKTGVLDEQDVCGENVDHAVVATGYEVEIQQNGEECLILQLKNSWGQDYGEAGYFYGRVCADSCGMLQKSTYVTV